jgi:hypothetical protein
MSTDQPQISLTIEIQSPSEVFDVPEDVIDIADLEQGLVFWGNLGFLNSRNDTGSLHLALEEQLPAAEAHCDRRHR